MMRSGDSDDGDGRRADPVALNHALIERLKQEGSLHDKRVEAAFRAIPRHLFLPDIAIDKAYTDEAIPTKQQDGQAISSSSQPAMMAIMLEQLKLEPGQRVLEIGAGTGFNAALMAYLVGERGKVVTLDIDEDIVSDARDHLDAAGIGGVEVQCEDGVNGFAEAAPYDRIILTVSAWDIAPAWRQQLKRGGRLVMPLSLVGGLQKSVAFKNHGDYLESASVHSCGFMRLRGSFAGPEATLSLGPEPRLLISVEDREIATVAAEQVYEWLLGPYQEIPTGIALNPSAGEVSGLSLWIGINEPRFCTVYAQTDQTQHAYVPYFWGMPGKWSAAPGILGDAGLYVLTRPQTEHPSGPVDLCVRAYGPDPGPAAHLREQVRMWYSANRPFLKGMSLRAYPREARYQPASNERIIAKHWTNLVLRWM